VHDKGNDWQGAQTRSRWPSATLNNLTITTFSRCSWFFDENQSQFEINMESTWLQSRGLCAFKRMQNVLEKVNPGQTRLQQDLKIMLFILGALFALVYVVRLIRIRHTNGRAWLKLRSRSPDPEKTNARKSAEKQTKSVRPFGSELTRFVIPSYHS
jgi:hypothetical protein